MLNDWAPVLKDWASIFVAVACIGPERFQLAVWWPGHGNVQGNTSDVNFSHQYLLPAPKNGQDEVSEKTSAHIHSQPPKMPK